MPYKNLEVWKLAKDIVLEIHTMSLNLPRFEMYEIGSQIRRSSKSIKSNIVEGFGRKKYKKDLIKFLIYAISSTDETKDHLETLFETQSLKDKATFEKIHKKLDILGKRLNLLIQAINKNN